PADVRAPRCCVSVRGNVLTLRYRSSGAVRSPVVLRIAGAGRTTPVREQPLIQCWVCVRARPRIVRRILVQRIAEMAVALTQAAHELLRLLWWYYLIERAMKRPDRQVPERARARRRTAATDRCNRSEAMRKLQCELPRPVAAHAEAGH